jgi:hypothetical protein
LSDDLALKLIATRDGAEVERLPHESERHSPSGVKAQRADGIGNERGQLIELLERT